MFFYDVEFDEYARNVFRKLEYWPIMDWILERDVLTWLIVSWELEIVSATRIALLLFVVI